MELTPISFGVIVLAALLVVIIAAWLSRKGVFAPPFERRPLMNQTELRLFRMLRAELPAGWSVMCQVSYGAFLRNKSYKRYMSINSKRADFVVLDAELNVAAVVEYQGTGHFGNSRRSRTRAEKSDAVKRQALREADIALIELPAKFDRDSVVRMIQTLAMRDDNGQQRIGDRR
ncbi:DUF2726 domain-containing protein [Roseinatronobacter alkalisoli]|uniref:DUF2726 domain-containing protein n=1 Tax=Roseinatronobacter alkalisoli TaxID=3028235 RepID=A0ABT5TG57_9RHOB|nr:DUF2726 domain-containing protein [Roseinatronobacter sp. HJB301]MDD7973939.1 DUF2726 domain-containing protein [Roseinatronobacter sp. HJB301]